MAEEEAPSGAPPALKGGVLEVRPSPVEVPATPCPPVLVGVLSVAAAAAVPLKGRRSGAGSGGRCRWCLVYSPLT